MKANADLWREQASFMREVGAVHAEFSAFYDESAPDDRRVELTKLTLAPLAPAPVARPTMSAPQGVQDSRPRPAASLARMHETMFAASSMKPRIIIDSAPRPEGADVPRAVSAQKAAARGAKKASKRNAR